jgi:hypothetical protein
VLNGYQGKESASPADLDGDLLTRCFSRLKLRLRRDLVADLRRWLRGAKPTRPFGAGEA